MHQGSTLTTFARPRLARAKNRLVQPFLKWAGGKRQLLREIRTYIPKGITRYYEPFLGGGAVLFDLQPKKGVVNDANLDVMNVYRVVRNQLDELVEALKKHKNEADYYYRIRELDRSGDFERLSGVDKAARIIYLNKTCYNGLFRVNSQGQFNVPFGRYHKPEIVNEVVLRAVSKYLRSSDLKMLNGDFEDALRGIRSGGFVYFDPPYDPVSDTASFTGYTLSRFDREEQLRLKLLCDKLDKKGCRFLLSNSATEYIMNLYSEYRIEIVQVARNINSVASRRGKIPEVLVRNYELE